jgi:murein L,D-transpeptidase YcbB/YkuD
MLGLLLSFGSAASQAAPECVSALCRLVATGSHPSLVRRDFSDYRARIQEFYKPSYALVWSREGQVTEQARAITELLKLAANKGLNADDYDGPRWDERLMKLSQSGRSVPEAELAAFDLLLTVSTMRYVSDLHFGRANPGLFHSSFDLDREIAGLPDFLRRRLINAPDVTSVLLEIEPPYDGYRRTEQALLRYLAIAREGALPVLPPSAKPVEPGTHYSSVPELARILRRVGDLTAPASETSASAMYEGAIVDAVRHFQSRHGLEPDGRLGKSTLAQLNKPLSRRILQLQLTLERWRWVPHHFDYPPIVVNIPEFSLRALNSSFGTDLEMRVVVGKAYGHQTPVFTAVMKYVVFRPYWDVPRSIQRSEMVPKLNRDPEYLSKNDLEVLNPKGTVVTKGAVNAEIIEGLRSGNLRIRQLPGPDNSLGLVKFLFPNSHNVYFHSTPAKELFQKTRRDFSHGCIRVEKPVELSAWVLRNQPEWTPENIRSAMNGENPRQVTLSKPIQVLIVYATAVVPVTGEVRFFDDIYKLDEKLERRLSARQ